MGGHEAGLDPPGPAVSPSVSGRPLLLRPDVPCTPEGSAYVPGAGSVVASCESQSTMSPSYHPLRSVSGGYGRRAIGTDGSGLRAEALTAAEEEREYVFPQGVLDRLAVQESLGVAARRRRKRSREDETAELDDASCSSEGGPSSRRDDKSDGGGHDNDGAGWPLA